MIKKRIPGNRIVFSAEKKLERKHYRIIVGLMIMGVIYYTLAPNTIGHDRRYSIYIFWLPTILGILLLALYRRQFLVRQLTTNKGVFIRAFMVVFYLIQGALFSYLSVGQIAKMSWDYANYRAAIQNSEENFRCKIDRFNKRRRPYSVGFIFNNRYERFTVNYRTRKKYRDKDPANYEMYLTVRKGIWNHYIVDTWKITEK